MQVPESSDALPSVPAKRYFTIGEVSRLCNVKPHVLRYWEQEFPQLSPLKRRGNRRYYQMQDIFTVRRIRSLLYEEGFTIAGARQQLEGPDTQTDTLRSRQILRQVRAELEVLATLLKS